MNCFIILGPQANASENVGTPHLRLTASSIKADTGCFPKKCQYVHGIENAINKTLLLSLDNNPFSNGDASILPSSASKVRCLFLEVSEPGGPI